MFLITLPQISSAVVVILLSSTDVTNGALPFSRCLNALGHYRHTTAQSVVHMAPQSP